MGLKDRILTEAITLFNEFGVAKVSAKHVANALGISPGNFTYHFKTKEILMQNIYERMHEDSKNNLDTSGYITLANFKEGMMLFDRLQTKYSFFFNDVVYIVRNFPQVAEMYERSNLMRFKQGRMLIDYYIASGRLQPESQDFNYDYLIHSVWMVSAFWTAQKQIIQSNDYKGNKTSSVEVTWRMIYPYLTEKGKEEFHHITEQMDNKVLLNN